MRWPAIATVPDSSTMPVNIYNRSLTVVGQTPGLRPTPRRPPFGAYHVEPDQGSGHGVRPTAIYASFLHVSFHGKFVGRDGMQAHAMQLDGVGASQSPGPAGHRERLQAAQ